MARILAPLLRPAVAAGRLMAPSAAVRSLSVPLLSGLGAGRSAVPPPPESSRLLRLLSWLGGPEPPAVEARPLKRRRYGLEWMDEYSWMEANGPEMQRHLKQESEYAEAILSGIRPLADILEEEMLGRLTEEQTSIPERLGPWEYFTHADKKHPMPTYLRRRAADPTDVRVILDGQQLEALHGYGRVGEIKVSRCQNFLAYTVDGGGDELFSCWVKDLRTGKILELDTIQSVGTMEWARDGCSLLYTKVDEGGRPSMVFHHVLGTPTGQDDLVVEERDPAAYLDVGRTKDWAFVLVSINSKSFSEVHLVSGNGAKGPRIVSPRSAGHQYFVEHSHGHLVILTNRGGSGFELATVPVSNQDISCKAWKTFLPRAEESEIEDLDMFDTCAVLYLRRAGMMQAAVLPMPPPSSTGSNPTASPTPLRLPGGSDSAFCLQPGVNPDPKASKLLLGISSPVEATKWLSFSLEDPLAPPELIHDEAGGGAWKGMECRRLQAPGEDGVSVPVTVFHRSGLRLDGSAPLLLCLYGAYGISMEVDFCPHRLSLLDRGWVVALAHCRGGGELGQAWHRAGRRLNKPNSLADARAVLLHLLSLRYSSHGKVALHAFSAGGLLLGHLVNEMPAGMLAAAWAQAPFVDLLTASTNQHLPLTVHEYDEWGDPADPKALKTIVACCPYFNAGKGGKPSDSSGNGRGPPALLISAALDDARVPFWGPAKWAARLRAKSVQGAPLLPTTEEPQRADGGRGGPVVLCVEESGGHFGLESQRVHKLATGYAFLINAASSAGLVERPATGDPALSPT